MKIGILQYNKNSFAPFFYDWIESLSQTNEHTFLFLGGEKYDFQNSSFIKLPFNLSFPFLRTKNFKPFFLENNLDICFVPESFNSDVEGCLLIFVTSRGLIFKKEDKIKKIQKNKHLIITPFSFFNKNNISENVFTIYPKLPNLKKNVSLKINDQIKTLENQNYLVCYSKKPNFDDVIFLLKAFSILKKKQKTEMQLVLLWKYIHPSISNKIKEYKYKKDIVLISNENAESIFTQIIPNSYAFISPFSEEKEDCAEQLFSLHTNTTIIAISNPFSKEIVGSAGILVSRKNLGELSDALKKIYIDERFKKELSAKAEQQYKHLSFSFNVKKLNTLLKEQDSFYKEYYFHIKK
ncbi:MAG: hypothetical protein ACRC0A_01125 [Chitinophagaceae bacterium]